MSLNNKLIKNFDNISISKPQRSRSPDLYNKSSKRRLKNDRRCYTLPSKFYHHHSNINNHPYFSQHTLHLCRNKIMGDPVDTSLLNNGVMFYQNPVNGELDYCWDDEAEICSPSLMPENNIIDEISGDSLDLEERCFQNMAKNLNKRHDDDDVAQTNIEGESKEGNLSPEEMESPNKDIISPENNEIDIDDMDADMDDMDDMDDMVKEMTELLNDNDDNKMEEPPSPLSPRDPERDGPAFSEEEENTEERGLYRLEHDPVFQDEAGLMYGDDSRGKIWPDDEGMDPTENQ